MRVWRSIRGLGEMEPAVRLYVGLVASGRYMVVLVVQLRAVFLTYEGVSARQNRHMKAQRMESWSGLWSKIFLRIEYLTARLPINTESKYCVHGHFAL